MQLIKWSIVVFLINVITGCSETQKNEQKKQQLTIYSGITMVKPINQLAKEFEIRHPNTEVKIIQGASGFLLKTVLKKQSGDIYFPGSDSYRKKAPGKDAMLQQAFVGFNRLAIMVAEGNPKNLSNDITQILNKDISVVLGSPDSGAVGKNTAKVLDKQGIKRQAYLNATYFTTDSHRLFDAIRSGNADMTLNWFAAASWPESRQYMDAIPLPESIFEPKKLELNLLKFSQNPKLALKFMDYASSEHGLETFKNFGFLTETELQAAIQNLKSKPQ